MDADDDRRDVDPGSEERLGDDRLDQIRGGEDDRRETTEMQADDDAGATRAAATRPAAEEPSRVSVVDEPKNEDDDEYQWHTGLNRPTGAPDAVEFVDVHKAFGRNKILRGLNMGIPEGMISMILGPSGTGKSVCI